MKKNLKRLLSMILVLVLSMAIAGCGKADTGGNTVTTAELKDTITIAIQYNPVGLDPTNNKMQDDFNIMNAIYDKLV